MPDKKITDLVDGSPVQPTDEFVVARAGDNFKIDAADVISAATAAVTKHDVTLGGNTAGALALVSSGTLTLVGGANITLSQAGNAVTISGSSFSQSVQPETQTFIGGISASDTLYTSGTVQITGVGGGITVSSNAGQRIDLSVAAPVAQTAQTQNVVDLTLSGNTAGALALISSGTATLAGGNNITLSQAGNGITISGANIGGAQTGISGFANSETTYTSGTVSLSALGGLTIRSSTGQIFQFEMPASSSLSAVAPLSISTNGSTISLLGPATSSLSATGIVSVVTNGSTVSIGASQSAQTQNVIDVSLSGNTSGALALVSSGTLTLAGGNNITLSQVGNAVTISGQNIPAESQTFIAAISASDTLYTSGSVRFTGSQAATVRSGTGQLVIIDVPVQSVQPETQTFLGGISASDTLYTSGTVRFTGVGGGVTVSSNTGQRVDISVAAQSVQPETQTFIAGISASNTLYTSGNVRFTGSQAVTVRSGTGQLVVIDAPAQSVQPETQTFVAGIANSQTTYTSGTVSLSELGAITIRSTTGNQYQLSVAAQSVQTQNAVDVTLSGNTSGAMALVSSGTLTLAGGNNITLSQAGNAVTISGPNVAGAQTGISGLANSETTYTSGSVTLSALGAITIRSTTGQHFQLSVNAQSVQPETQTFIAGISASDTLYTSGNVRFTGVGGGVTVSSNTGQRVDISVAAQSVQPETQTFVGGIGNSQVTYTSGTVNLSVVAGNLTIRSTTGQAFQFSMSQTVQAETQTAISGIANSQTTYTSGTVSLSELGAVTIRSTTGNQFQISVNAQTAQTGISGVANSQTTYTSGTVSLSELGAITIRSTTGNQYQFSVNAQTVQTQTHNVTLAGNSTSAGAGYIQISTGTMTLAGGNNVTLSQNGNAVTISAGGGAETQTAISGIAGSNTTYTSGTALFTGVGGGVTVSSNTGQRIDISVAAPVAQTNQSGNVYASSNTFGTSSGTFDARSISIAGRGAVSVAASNSGWVISAPTQSVQPETQTFIAGIANSQTTYTSGTVSWSELGAVTVRSTTGNQFQISVNAQTAQTQSNIAGLYDGANSISTGTIRVTDANGVTFSVNGQTLSASVNQSISMFAVSNTTQSSSGTAHKSALSFGGAGIASVGVTGGSVVISVPSGGGAGYSAGVSTGGNTAGATGITGTQLVLVGSNNITLSQTTGANGGTVSINAPASSSLSAVAPLSISTNGSTISLLAPATSSLSATGLVSISTNGSTISIGASPIDASFWRPSMPLLMGATQGVGASAATQTTVTAWVMPMSFAGDLNFNNINLAAHVSFSSATTSISSVNYSFSMGASLGFYTLNGSTMSRVTSFSGSLGYTNATSANVTDMRMGATVGMGGSSTTKSTLGGANMTAIMSSINSVRQVPLNWSTQSHTLTGGQYWVVGCFTQLTAGAAQASLSQVGFESSHSIMGSAFNPPEMMQNTASVTSPYPFLGHATLVNSSNELLPVSFATSKITTATAIANSTKFQSLWMRIYRSHSN